jgi:hypothetical protein
VLPPDVAAVVEAFVLKPFEPSSLMAAMMPSVGQVA